MRATYKVTVEVTAEVESADEYSNERLAEDLRDMVFAVVREETELDVVIQTISPAPEPHPADNVSYAPCVKGTIEIGDTTTEFMLPLLNDSMSYSQWGAPTYTLGERGELVEGMATAAQEWASENLCRTCKENLLDDGEGYDGECGDCADKTEGKRSSTCTVCHEEITRDEDDEWVHSDGDKYCGTGDGAMALPEDEDDDD
jgi:hypothetical protein